MLAFVLSTLVSGAASGQPTAAATSSVTWTLLQVFAVFCITLAGLVRLTKPRT